MDTTQNEPVNIKQEAEEEMNIEAKYSIFVPIQEDHKCEHFEKSESSVFVAETVESIKTKLEHDFFLCEVCEETFETEAELTYHKAKNPECDDEDFRVKHEIFHVKDEPQDEMEIIYICSSCNKICGTKKELIDHKKENEQCHEHKKCTICEDKSTEDFSCSWELKDHLKAAHEVEDQNFIWPMFPTSGFSESRETTDVLFQCKFCMRGFVRWKNCRKHEKTHHGRVEFKCEFCPKTYSRSFSGYKLHLDSHLKPFQCNFCLKCFSQNKHLAAHVKIIHTDNLYQCQYCPTNYSSQAPLVDHTKIHTGSFQCNMCLRSFHKPSLKSIHEKMHIMSNSLEIPRRKVIKLVSPRTEQVQKDTFDKL